MENEEFDRRLRKELETIFRQQSEAVEEPPPCVYHRMVPPLGCIMGWDMAQCDYCSFYRPVERPKKRNG